MFAVSVEKLQLRAPPTFFPRRRCFLMLCYLAEERIVSIYCIYV